MAKSKSKGNQNIISISGITPETKAKLEREAEKRDVAVSKLIRDLVLKHYVNEDDTSIVMLNIPNNLKKDASLLRTWLNHRVEAIVQRLAET